MLQKIKVLTLAVALGISSFLVVGGIPFAQADAIDQSCTQWQIDQGLCEPGLRALVLKMVNWFLLFLGLTATGFLIYGGFMYTTSAGNDENINKAKKIIIYAAIGILIIVLAAVLVNALIDMVSTSRVDNL